MKIIVYLIVFIVCLVTVPFAFPFVLIFAILHMLESMRTKKQKKVIVEALREAGVSPQDAKGLSSQRQKSYDSSPSGKFSPITLLGAIVLIAVIGKVFQDGDKTTVPDSEYSTQDNNVSSVLVNSEYSFPEIKVGDQSYSYAHICSAAIAAIMGRPLEIMTVKQGIDDIVNVSYVLTQDFKPRTYDYDCKINNDKIIWRSNWDGVTGRWRDGSGDTVVKYQIDSQGLTIFEGQAETMYPASRFR